MSTLDHEAQMMAVNAIGNEANRIGIAGQQAMWDIANAHTAPSAVYRPKLTLDGNQWCALYGIDLVQGIAGFGDTPEKAMEDFDRQWKGRSAVGINGKSS